MKTRYSHDRERGQIRDIVFKDIHVMHEPYHIGYTVSLLSGASADKPIERVTLENFYLGKEKVTGPEPLELLTRYCGPVTYR